MLGCAVNYYPHHLGDYDGATAHLSWDEDMAYSRLLRVYYRREKPIPLDPGETFRLVRAMNATQKKAVSAVLEEFFIEEGDGWHNKRADEEIAKAVEKGMKAKASAGKRWHADDDANAMRTHSEGIAKALLEPDAKAMLPITNNQEPRNNTPQFEAFWTAYPRKVAKHDAAKAFKKLALANGDFEKVLTALESAKASEQWLRDDGKFIPHAATWLNGRRFEDEGAQRPVVKFDA